MAYHFLRAILLSCCIGFTESIATTTTTTTKTNVLSQKKVVVVGGGPVGTCTINVIDLLQYIILLSPPKNI